MTDNPTLDRALAVRQLARRWGVSVKLVRCMIRRKIVAAIDVGIGGRQRWRITPEAVTEAERRLAVGTTEVRRRKRTSDIDRDVLAMLEDAS